MSTGAIIDAIDRVRQALRDAVDDSIGHRGIRALVAGEQAIADLCIALDEQKGPSGAVSRSNPCQGMASGDRATETISRARASTVDGRMPRRTVAAQEAHQ